MSDEDDEETILAEFAPEAARTILTPPSAEVLAEAAAPVAPVEPFVEPVTDRHHLARSAEFLAGLEVGRAEGDKAGYARGLAEGRAEVKAIDWGAGVEDALAGVRLYLLSEGIIHVEAFTDKVLPFVKRSG